MSFLIRINEWIKIVQSFFHAVICLFYRYWIFFRATRLNSNESDKFYKTYSRLSRRVSCWSPAFWTVEFVNANSAGPNPAFSSVRIGSIVLIRFLGTLPGKKFVNSGRFSSFQLHQWQTLLHTEQPLVVQCFELFACQSCQCVGFIDSRFLSSLAVCAWNERLSWFSQRKSGWLCWQNSIFF